MSTLLLALCWCGRTPINIHKSHTPLPQKLTPSTPPTCRDAAVIHIKVNTMLLAV